MNKLIATTLLILIGGTFSHAQSLLWQVEGNGLEQPSYLFGTIHIQDKRVYNFNDSLSAKMDEVDQFVLEMDLSLATLVKARQAFLLPDDKTLPKILSAEAYKKLTKLIDRELGEGQMLIYDHIHPFAITAALTKGMTTGESAETALDLWLYNMGVQMGKKMIGLETMDDQVAIFDLFGSEEVISFCDGFDDVIAEFEDLIQTYIKADLNELNRLIEEQDDYSQEFLDALFKDRNISMSRKIDSIIKQASTFVAVGAGHLGGEGGIIKRLQTKGYTVRPIIAPKNPWPEEAKASIEIKQVDMKGICAVDMPGLPTYNEVPLGEDGTMHMFLLQMTEPDPNLLYGASVIVDVLDHDPSEEELATLIATTGQSTAQSANGTILEQINTEYDGCKAQLYDIDMRDGLAQFQLVIIYHNRSLILLQTVCQAADKDNEKINQFFDSFKINR